MRSILLEGARLEALLGAMARVRAVVVGDVCLDAYWIADMRLSTLSRETPHHNMPVVEERYALGGAGNVMANMRALGARVLPITCLGQDWRGELALGLMREMDLVGEGLVRGAGFVTPTYVKPYRTGHGEVRYESPRIDFENHAPLGARAEDAVIRALNLYGADAQVVAVSDQMAYGVVGGRVRQALAALARSGKIVVVDSRERVAQFVGCIVKPNELESARAAGLAPGRVTAEDYLPVAQALKGITGASVIITLGGRGSMCLDGAACYAPPVDVPPPIDIVGAGDSFLSACALALGAGAQLEEAIALGNLASAVTIQKLGQTGTASAREIIDQRKRQG